MRTIIVAETPGKYICLERNFSRLNQFKNQNNIKIIILK